MSQDDEPMDEVAVFVFGVLVGLTVLFVGVGYLLRRLLS